MTIDELLEYERRREFAAMPETDALTEEDGLQEAYLRDVRFNLREACLAMLFDLRTALQFRMANTAVLVMRGVERAEFVRAAPPGIRFALEVATSAPSPKHDLFSFELLCEGGSQVNAVSAAAEFFVGDIPGLPSAPPNLGDDDEAMIVAGMPAWNSTFIPGWATFIDQPGTRSFGHLGATPGEQRP